MISAHLGNSQFRGTVLADVESFDSPPRGSQSYHRGRQPGHVSVWEGEPAPTDYQYFIIKLTDSTRLVGEL